MVEKATGALTQPLAGQERELFHKVTAEGKVMEQHSNLSRVEVLLMSHPEVESVRRIKTEKAQDPSEFDDNGRAKRFHQEDFDLEILLADSGASFTCGITTNEVAQPYLAFWWKQGHGMRDSAQRKRARAVMFDSWEVRPEKREHQQPILGMGWQEAWRSSPNEGWGIHFPNNNHVWGVRNIEGSESLSGAREGNRAPWYLQ